MSVCFIAHAGFAGKYLENSEEGFLEAARYGFGGIETDVRATADGVLVTNHDEVVHYEDGTELMVSEHTYEELIRKPLRNRFTDKKLYLCTYQRYLEICRDAHMVCFIEFKGEFSDEMTHKAFTMAGEIYDLEMCELQSFNYDNLLRAHKAFPDLKIMLTCCRHDADVDRCLIDGFDIDMDIVGINEQTVKMFHEKGLKVGIWTANTKESLAFCVSLKPDFIESDFFCSEQGA